MNRSVPELLKQASAVLAREVARMPNGLSSGVLPNIVPGKAADPGAVLENVAKVPHAAGYTCPVTGASLPLPGSGNADLRTRAHELVASLMGLLGPLASGAGPLSRSGPSVLDTFGSAYDRAPAGQRCPVTHAAVPAAGFDRDQLRRQAHQFIEALLTTFNDATGEKELPAEDQVPLVRAPSPVQPGEVSRTHLSVANEESTPSQVTLYCSNFSADRGYEIPSVRVTISPRQAVIPARGRADFEVSIATPQQTPAGTYAGLIQAMGNAYFKAVLCVEVL